MRMFRVVALTAAAASVFACSSNPGGPNNTSPGTPVTLSVAPAPQTQGVEVPQASGPVTGTVSIPPVTTSPANATGDLTLSFLSGASVAFVRASPPKTQSVAKQRDSDSTLPGGPYIFEMTVTAPFEFTLASVPAFTLNLGSLNPTGAPASYVLVVQDGAGVPYQFVATAQDNIVSFPGAQPALTVSVGTTLTFGVSLASNVPPAATITSFTASQNSLPVDGGSVTLAWNVTGATALSIDNAVGPVTPLTTGTATTNVPATSTFTLTATNANAITTAATSVCVATGPVTAAITSPASYSQCSDSFLTSIVMTNGSCSAVTISVIGFVSTVSGPGTCGFNGPDDYTSANANLPFSVDAGVTERVFDLTNGEIGCCPTSAACSINCNDTLEWTLTTNIGPVSAPSIPFTIDVTSCNLPVCP